MRAAASAGAADDADDLTARDLLTGHDAQRIAVRIHRFKTVAVANADHVAVAAVPARRRGNDRAAVRRQKRLAAHRDRSVADVQSIVSPAVAAGHVAANGHRPQKTARRNAVADDDLGLADRHLLCADLNDLVDRILGHVDGQNVAALLHAVHIGDLCRHRLTALDARRFDLFIGDGLFVVFHLFGGERNFLGILDGAHHLDAQEGLRALHRQALPVIDHVALQRRVHGAQIGQRHVQLSRNAAQRVAGLHGVFLFQYLATWFHLHLHI